MLRVALLGPGVATAASLLMALALLAGQQGFGQGDFVPFAVWTIPLPGLVLFLGLPLRVVTRHWDVGDRLALYGVLGAGIGLGWTFMVAALLGPFFKAFSFTPLVCWLIGGAGGMLVMACPPIKELEEP